MNIRQRLLTDHVFLCIICDKRVIDETDAVVKSASSRKQTPVHGLAYVHVKCEGKKEMKKSNAVEKEVLENPPKRAPKTAVKKADAKKAEKKTKKTSTRISKSGKYESIRHMMEALFKGNKKLESEEAVKAVKKEYPASAFNGKHFAWYKAKIMSGNATKNR